MKRITNDSAFGYLGLFSKAQRKLAGFVSEGCGDFEHDPDFGRREAGEDGVESDGEVRLNEHFAAPVDRQNCHADSLVSPTPTRKMNGSPRGSGSQNKSGCFQSGAYTGNRTPGEQGLPSRHG